MNKLLILAAVFGVSAFAQESILNVIPLPTPAKGTVTVTIADQGAEPMQLVTGVKIATATLLDATTCNESDTDETVDNSMVYQRVNAKTIQPLTLYDSQVVKRVLTVFQDKSVYAKLFKAGSAAASISSILQLAFKLNPITGVALQVAPAIYSAVLPVVHSPEDLAALINDIVPQNAGGKIAGHTCRAGLVIARTKAAVKTEVIDVQ